MISKSASREQACANLAALHATAVVTDRHAGQETSRVTVEASLAAHRTLREACEDVRRAYYPRAGRMFVVFGEVFTVSPRGRRITCVWSERQEGVA